jgi:hypothetical protein
LNEQNARKRGEKKTWFKFHRKWKGQRESKLKIDHGRNE